MSGHRPIMLREVVRILAPAPGEIAVDCTLGGGGHAEGLLEHLNPGGRLIGLDVDRRELARTEARLREVGLGADRFTTHHTNFAGLSATLRHEGLDAVDLLLVDLGVSSMQADDPGRGFSYKTAGPLDMRLDPTRGETASELLARLDEAELALLLRTHADEPQSTEIARLLKRQPLETTQSLERCVRLGLAAADPRLTKPAIKMSVRRTFQALRIAVNDELSALDALLTQVPHVLRPGGRVVFLTFHSGEDRRVKRAFRSGHRAGVFSAVARTVTRSSTEETRSNRRSSSAKLRWAIRT